MTTREMIADPDCPMLHVTTESLPMHECVICGSTLGLRHVPLMTGEPFGVPLQYPVCTACALKWIDSRLGCAGAIVEVRAS